MSTKLKYLLEVIPRENNWALDLGSGSGMMPNLLCRLGYKYVNLDIQPFDIGLQYLAGCYHYTV